MNNQKFIVVLLVVFCAQNALAGSISIFGWRPVDTYNQMTNFVGEKVQAVKTAIVSTAEDISNGVVKAVGFVRDVATVTYGKLTAKIAKIAESAKEFITTACKHIAEFTDRCIELAKKVAIKVGEIAVAVFNEAKQVISDLFEHGFMEMLCNRPAPSWVTSILDAKDRICETPIDLMSIKDEVMEELYLYKEQSDNDILEFAKEFKDRIQIMSNELKAKTPSAGQVGKMIVDLYTKISDAVFKFDNDLKVASPETTDDILEDAGNIARDSNQFLIMVQNSQYSGALDVVKELVAEIYDITNGVGSIMSAIVRGIIKALEFAEDLCEKVFSLIKNFIDDVPEKLFGADDDDSESMQELKTMGEIGTGMLLQQIAFVAEQALEMGIKYVEKILDAKKNMACDIINAKIKIFLKIRDFTCGVYFNRPAPNNTLIDELNISWAGFKTDMALIESCAANPKTDGKLRDRLAATVTEITTNENYHGVKDEIAGFIIAQTQEVSELAQNEADSHNKKLVSGLVNQLRTSAKKCKDHGVEFTMTRLEFVCGETGKQDDDDIEEVGDKVAEEMITKITEISEGKTALKECLQSKKEYAKKKFQALKTGAKKLLKRKPSTTPAPASTKKTKNNRKSRTRN